MIRVTKWLLLILIGLTLLASVVAFWLLSTQSGLRWAVNRVPEVLQVESIKGDASEFSFTKLQLKLDGVTVKIRGGSLSWGPMELLGREVSVNALQLDKVEIDIVPVESAPTPYAPWQGLDLPVDIVLRKAAITDIKVTTPEPIIELSAIELAAKIESNFLTLTELRVSESQSALALAGQVDLSARPDGVVNLEHSVDWQAGQTKVLSSGSVDGTWASLTITQDHQSPVAAQIDARVDDTLSELLKWTAQITTSAIDEQAVLGQAISVADGSITASGEFAPARGLLGLKAAVQGQIKAGNQEFSFWQLESDVVLDNNELTVNKVQLTQQDQREPAELLAYGSVQNISSFAGQSDTPGNVELEGNWSSLTWPLNGSSESGNTPQLDSNGQFSVSGSSNQYRVLSEIAGKSFGQDLNAKLDVLIASGVLDVKNFKLVSGGSSFTAKGQLGEQFDLNWDLNSPNLGDFVADGSGSMTSSGTITGTQETPAIELQLASKTMSIFGYSARDISVSADGSLANASQALDLQMRASAVSQNDKTVIKEFDLAVDGNLRSHALVINSVLPNDGTLELKAKGGLVDNKWNGDFTRLIFNDPVLDTWSLQDAVAIELSAGEFSVSQGCLYNKAQSVCFEAEKNSDSLSAEANLVALDLANLNRVSKLYDINVAGQLDGEVSYLTKPEQPSGVIEGYLESKSTVLTWQETDDDEPSEETLSFESIRAEIKQLEGLTSSVDIKLSDSDSATMQLSVAAPIESSEFTKADIAGAAAISIADLSVLPTVLLESISLNGALKADVDLAGSLGAPKVNAQAQLSDAAVDLPELGLELRDITVDVTSKGTSRIDIDGQVKSGEGLLGITGDINFTNLSAPAMTIKLNGDNLQLANTPELIVAGDVDFNVSLVDQELDLRGSVMLAKAELDFKIPETAITVSDDVVLEGVEVKESALKTRLKLSIDLGEQTQISAQGLDANLLGKLVVSKTPKGILRGEGEIRVNDGRYRAYGQDLKIDKGRLIFDGGSIDDPSLNLTAEKTIEAIVAGVSVTGRASSPRLNLYSTPSMQDEDILSVLIFNKPVGDLGSQDGLALLRIANSLRGDGTSGVTKMTDKLQRSLGLTNLELQTSNNAPSIVAGKQLSSKLYVGYGYGLLDAAQSLILRYNLNQAWSVKADLGPESGADLRYQLER